MAADELGKEKEFHGLFKSDGGGDPPAIEETPPTELKATEEEVVKPPEETGTPPVETPPEEKAVTDPPTEEPPAEVKDPEIPEEYRLAKQFAEQYFNTIKGLANMSPEDQQLFYQKSTQQAPAAKPSQPAFTDEQFKDMDEYNPGLSDFIKRQSADMEAMKNQMNQNQAMFSNQADVNFQNETLKEKEKFLVQETKLQKEFPSLEAEDIDSIRKIGYGISVGEMQRGNQNFVVDLYSVGKAYASRMNKSGKKPPTGGGTNNSGVLKPTPPQTIPLNKDGEDGGYPVNVSVESTVLRMLDKAERSK